jgi:uncharacterized protein YyaL (SSP411 family)
VTNRLADETSPYLRQHRDNPVDWYPWGPEAFAAAHERNVPVLLSVGYSACHWCHVMAHECFEDEATAALMNEQFVNVKVDREERPDVDQIYMDAVQAMTGRGGWPMTVFLTPAGEPFYGGTYFPRDRFQQLLRAIAETWHTKQADVRQNVGALLQAVRRTTSVAPVSTIDAPGLLDRALRQIGDTFDRTWGGFGAPPKFFSTFTVELALRAFVRHGHPNARTVVDTSLHAMASGGVYDHLGGGFARYSTDERWEIPHFEKMLYDQALLARLYGRAAIVFDDAVHRQVATETIEYVLRDLRHPSGGFCSAEDADAAFADDPTGSHHEGAFAAWTLDQIRVVLGDDPEALDAALDWYEFDASAARGGNFEGRLVPVRLAHRGDLLRPPAVERARAALFDARARRPRPGLDDKVLTEWNAMFLATLAELAAAFDRADWLDAAIANAEFLLRELRTDDGLTGRWARSWHADGTPPARHAALAADHAHLVDAFTRLAEASGQARWIGHARDVADTMLDHFWDLDHGGLFTVADDGEALVARQKDLIDNALPSANGVAANALLRLAALTGEMRYAHQAEQILLLIAGLVPQAPTAFAHALAGIDLWASGPTELVVTGDRPDLVAVATETWRPSLVVAWGEPYDSPLWEGRDTSTTEGLAFVCRDFACQSPTGDVGALRTLLAATPA